MKVAARLGRLPPYPFARWSREVRAAEARGTDVIRLDIGNPDLPPPAEIIDILNQSARHPDHHGYPGFRGLPAFREAVARYYERRFGVVIDSETQVVPLIGSKEGIINMALACLDPGDLALVPDPGYAPYALSAALAGAEAYHFPLRADHGFLPDLDAIPTDVAERARMMWLNYPNNPTGATADLAFLADAVAFSRAHDILLCHDAPYTEVAYDGYVAPSVLQVDGAQDVAIELNSLSKMANMAGWRVGMAVGNVEAVAALGQVKSNIDSGIFRPLQEAAVAALSLDQAWIDERNAIYAERIEIVIAALRVAGLPVERPRATLYVWAPIPGGWRSEMFGLMVLRQAGVAVAPGSFFGPGGKGYVRISVTAPTPRLEEAMERLVRFVEARGSTAAGENEG